ncbi:hypothetical protein [Candidatus Thiodiazotropha sp. LNASS1]
MSASLTDKMEDHALESVPEADRIGWLKISWNTTRQYRACPHKRRPGRC